MSVMPAETLVALQRDAEAPLFVINLCASTTPVTLTPPSTPELKRFNFFVTRQREDGRERFRLHMGYFATQEEADVVLSAVRDVYPAAWSGPAPTNRASAARSHAVAARPAPTAAAPVLAAAAEPVAAFAAPAATVARAVPAAAVPVAPVPVVAPAPVAAPVPVAAPAAPKAAARRVPVRSAPADVIAPAAKTAPAHRETLDAMSNVREVLALLADDPPRPADEPRKVAPMPASALPPAPQPVAPAPVVPAPAEPLLSATRTLAVLEAKAQFAEPGSKAAADIRVITPEDTQTLRDISLDAQNAAPAAYAVQLCWSVTPVDADSLPHLAIFDAYTLYNVEGNRQGRRWYGLRLGFFTDPDAARQVAHYVRSDYATVAVVPVTTLERDRASDSAPAEPSAPGDHEGPPRRSDAVQARPGKLEAPRSDVFTGFELLQDDRPVAPRRDVEDIAQGRGTPPVLKPAVQPANNAAGARGAKPDARPTVKRAVARKPLPVMPGAAQPLEETLEMLGASTLTLDESREIIREPLGRDAPKKPKKGPGARFSSLLTRLSNRG